MSMSGISLREVSPEDWPALAQGFRDFSFEQSQTYAVPAAARIGGAARFVVLERGGGIVAAAAVRLRCIPGLRRGVAWIPSGPLLLPIGREAPDGATLQAVFEALRHEFTCRLGHVLRLRLPSTAFHDNGQIDAVAAAAGFGPCRRAPGYRSFAIDLRKDQGHLLRDLSGKWRTDLRFAQKSELALQMGRGTEFEARFQRLFDEILGAKGFRPDIMPAFHFGLSGPDLSHIILIATKDGVDLAGIVIGVTGTTAVYLFGATSEAGRPLRAGYFLSWEGIAWARSQGCQLYDLGGVDFETNPDVARFKERMNGLELLAPGPYEARPGRAFSLLVEGIENLRGYLRQRKGST